MSLKTGKEVKINTLKNYNVVFGTINNKHSKSIYINISAWGSPESEHEVNYTKVIKDMNKKIKQTLFNSFDTVEETEFLKDMTIVDLDIKKSGIRHGKRSFMNCEITLFLKSETPVNSDKMKPILDEVLNTAISSTFEGNKSFKFYKKKI